MESQSSDEKEEFEISIMHKSVNFGQKKNILSIEEDKKGYIKRSSSLSLIYPKNFVPKLKPIKTNICPSPINLNQKSPDSPEKLSLNPNEINLKPIKIICPKKRKLRKSTKFLNIEEETHETEAISDYEDKYKKATLATEELESSKSDIEDNDNIKGDKKINFLKNINVIRKKMETIKNSFINYDNINDDSNITNNFAKKRLYYKKKIYQEKYYDKIRQNKNMNLDPLKCNKNRTKSFNIRQGFVSTILGFLEKSNSSLSLNAKGE